MKSSPRPKSPASATAGKNVSLRRLLSEDLIVVSKEDADKEKLIAELVGTLCRQRSLGDPGQFLRKVLERERGISTTLDTGLAVPHARMDDLSDIAATFALVPAGITDPSQPDLRIRAIFLFFSPNRQDSFTQHLHLLRGVSSLFQPDFIDELLQAPSNSAVLKRIIEKENAV